jgi:hypothetical protein
MSEDLDALFGGGARGGVWGLIERSELAKTVKQDVERERVGAERTAMKRTEAKVKMEIWEKTPEEVMKAARDLVRNLQSAYSTPTPLMATTAPFGSEPAGNC